MKKILPFLLAVTILTSLISFPAFADPNGNGNVQATITAITASDTTIEENSHGTIQSTDGVDWFCYDPVEPSGVVITMSDGNAFGGDLRSAMYNLSEHYGNYNLYYGFTRIQSAGKPFLAGNSYEAVLTIGSVSTTYRVTLIQNPIAELSAENTFTYENNRGDYRYDADLSGWWFFYDPPTPANITVTTRDGKTLSGPVYSVLNSLYSLYGIRYNYSSSFNDDQNEQNHFLAGNAYPATFQLNGVTADFHVTIQESPIKMVMAENTDLYEDEYTGSYQQTQDGDTWFRYDCKIPSRIAVQTTDGVIHTGEFYTILNELEEAYGEFFQYHYYFTDYQSSDQPFIPGNAYNAVFYLGGKTANYSVNIRNHPITSITAGNLVIYEHHAGYEAQTPDGQAWYRYTNIAPSSVTITTLDGEVYTGSIWQVVEQLYEKYGQRFSYRYAFKDQQSYDNQFVVGGSYDAVLTVSRKTADYTVSIEPPPTSGTCGDNVTWQLDNDGTLTISGTGATADFQMMGPWTYVSERINRVVIENGVTAVGEYAFRECPNLTSVQLSDSVARIDPFAFYHCYSLQSVAFGNGLEQIGTRAFADCSSLDHVTIPASVTEIGDGVFCGCTSLDDFTVSGNNQAYCMDEYGALYSSDMTQLLFVPSGISGAYTVPGTVTRIVYGAFASCRNLAEVALPETLESIGDSAFSNCSSLQNLRLPQTVQTIGTKAFDYCTSLVTMTIPENVTSIRELTFVGCSNLEEVVFRGYPPAFASYAFYDVTLTAYYPAGKGWTSPILQNYGGRITWIERLAPFTRLLVLPSDLTEIQSEAFLNVAADAVLIPEGATTIGDNAFNNIVIIGTPGTEAESYAERGNLSFISTDDYLRATENNIFPEEDPPRE